MISRTPSKIARPINKVSCRACKSFASTSFRWAICRTVACNTNASSPPVACHFVVLLGLRVAGKHWKGGRGREGGSGTKKSVCQKWPDKISPIVTFVFSHDGHFGLGGFSVRPF